MCVIERERGERGTVQASLRIACFCRSNAWVLAVTTLNGCASWFPGTFLPSRRRNPSLFTRLSTRMNTIRDLARHMGNSGLISLTRHRLSLVGCEIGSLDVATLQVSMINNIVEVVT